MGQANLAQREPSMEEILASIRRIIEDGDGGRGAEDGELDVAKLRSEAANSAAPKPFAVTPDLRADPAPRAAAPMTSPSPAAAKPVESRVEPQLDTDAFDVALSAEELTSLPRDSELRGSSDTLERQASAAAERVRARSQEIARTLDPADLEDSEPARSAIVSDSTGRQVAAAFDELSAAFEMSRTKSFDEMAEDMLRPMLQDWLDNNLPTLVEKLVREEIERVARSGR